MKEEMDKGFKNNKIKPTPSAKPEIGIDTDKDFINDILDAASVSSLDLNSINNLVQSAQNREQSYELIDIMCQDDRISTVLETFAGEVVQPNDQGEIVWAASDDPDVLNYVNWLIDSLSIAKHIYQWTYCLISYGDVYVRLFRESDEEDDLLFKIKNKNVLNDDKFNLKSKSLNEDVKVKLYSNNDKYVNYIQMVDNPGEMFDLQKFGKTHGYIKAPINVVNQRADERYDYITRYSVKQKDVEVYDATSFAHGYIENTNQRQPETVEVFLNTEQEVVSKDKLTKSTDSMSTLYNVKRGQSILYNLFRTWRELNLLELSALLNRLTKSSLVRIIQYELADMPPDQVRTHMHRLKEKMEQKASIDTNKGMQDYTAAGPIDNTIYVPTNNGKGVITATNVGGDFDPKSLVDIEYFRDRLYGALKVPKQFFCQTGDSTGFNGGSSLTIISAQHGKDVKKIQNIMCQLVTDIINLFLIDRGLLRYVNKFTIRMQPPTTQEDIDRRTAIDNNVTFVGNIMQQTGELIEDPVTKLKLYKSLISNVINNSDAMSLLNDYITSLETKNDKEGSENKEKGEDLPDLEESINKNSDETESQEVIIEALPEQNIKEPITEDEEEEQEKVDSYLPSPSELGLDLSDDNIFDK